MTADQLAQLESEFGLSFPHEYRELLLCYPLERDYEELTANPEELARTNRGCREQDPWQFPWRKEFWWIGADGSGGFFFINCQERNCHVYYLDHEDPAVDYEDRERLKPQPLAEYSSALVASDAEFELHRQQRLDQIANRKWWQFWVPRQPPQWLSK